MNDPGKFVPLYVVIYDKDLLVKICLNASG